MAQKFLQVPALSLYSGLSASATSMVVTPYPVNIQDGTTKLVFADFGVLPTCTIDPKISGYEEIVSFTGITDNLDNTATLTGLTRNLTAISPYTTPGTGRQHGASAVVVFSDNPQMYARLMSKENDETVTGIKTFATGATPKVTDAPTVPTEVVNKAYADALAIAGSPDATITTKGIGRVSVAPVAPTIPIFVGDNDTRVPTIAQTASLVGNNTDIAVGSGNKMVTQTGLQHNSEKYAADAGSTDTYVITLSPVPTSYTNGMVVYFKANTVNTGAATINVNGLGAKTIVKAVSTALADGDIAALSLNTLIYDGTNFVLQSPIATLAPSGLYAVNADETIITYNTIQLPFIPTTTALMAGWTVVGTTPFTYDGAASYVRIADGGGVSAVISTKIIGNGSTTNYSPAQSKIIRYKQMLRVVDTTDRKGWGFCITSSDIHTAQTDVTNGEIRFILNGATLYSQNANGTATSTDISSGITMTNWNMYEIVFTPTVDIKFYINGTLKATHTTNLPTTGTFLLAMGNNINGRQIDMMAPVISVQN